MNSRPLQPRPSLRPIILAAFRKGAHLAVPVHMSRQLGLARPPHPGHDALDRGDESGRLMKTGMEDPFDGFV